MSARISSGKGSKQNYGTPWPLFNVLEKYFQFGCDLAADEGNHKCPFWYGPGGIVEDAFTVDWSLLRDNQFYWLNPPYNDIPRWYQRVAYWAGFGAKFVSLVPMDSAKDWFDYVPERAGIWQLQGRVKFDGATQAGAKDSALHIWDRQRVGEFRVFNWRKNKFLI